jgi:type II secretory pathway pseudopilin PulG
VTILEMVVTVAVLSVAIVAILGSLNRATTTTTFTQKRNAALDDLRVMAAAFGKDARQGIRAQTATSSEFAFTTYVDGEQHDVLWRAVSSGGEDRLERIVDGGVANVYVVDLTVLGVFSFFGAASAGEVDRVRLDLYTVPDDRFEPVGLSTEVEMRNVG